MSHAYHLALYGNVSIPRAYCTACDGFALVIRGKLACCGQTPPGEPKIVKRMSEPEQRRRLPSLKERRQILAEQRHRCFYCDRALNSYLVIDGELVQLRIEWDHAVPYAYSQNNQTRNFVAACFMCNQWKSSRMFVSVDEARVYLYGKWQAALAG